MHNFRELKVWQKSIELAGRIYSITDDFPSNERFGLISQMRRSAVSIASNIAEGAGRLSNKEFRQFLNISLGSCYELETQIIISQNLDSINLIAQDDIVNKTQVIQMMITGLIKSMK